MENRFYKMIFQLIFVLSTLIFTTTLAFNLDTSNEHIRVIEGPTGSDFGFKVQAYRNLDNETVLVVSAPKLNNLVAEFDRPGQSRLVRGHGGLLVCRQDEKQCNKQFFFETKRNLLHRENRTNQNLGWSLQIGDSTATSDLEVPLVACAPMWRFRHGNVSEMTGACFLSRIDRQSDSILVDGPNTTPFYPCLYHYSLGYHRQGYCQAGMSSTLGLAESYSPRPKPGIVVLGAPGGTYWAGGAYAAPLHGAWMVNQNAVPDFRAMAAGPKEKRDNNSIEFDNGLFGYAMASYSVELPNRKETLQGIAISGIKTKALGEVVLASMSLARNEASVNYFKNNSVVRGQQLSEAFGFSLACGDVDGDGLPEIFIGAPFYFANSTETNQDKSSKNGNGAPVYDSGRVYIFKTRLEESDVYADYGPPYNLVFEDPSSAITVDGMQSGSRFGSAMDFLNDINDDGYGDLAISAPYGGTNGLGVVYIYLGSEKGLQNNAKPSQVIEASKMPQFALHNQPSMRRHLPLFGYTVQGRYDVDSNDYPDLVVGAIGADSVVVIRSRPVAKLMASVAITPKIVGTPVNGIIRSNCRDGPSNFTYLCAELLYCVGYSGKSLPKQIDVGMTVDADVLLTNSPNPQTSRAYFDDDKPSTFQKLPLRSTEKYCRKLRIRILRAAADLLSPIVFKITISTLPPPPDSDPEQLIPIFSTGETFIVNTTAEIAKDCGPDNICIPNFRVDLAKSSKRRFILGDTKPYLLNLTIQNDGEEAYGGKVTVSTPQGALFNGREVYEVLVDGTTTKLEITELLCSVKSRLANSSEPQAVVCRLPQPFRKGRAIEIRMSFSMASLQLEEDQSSVAKFNISVSSLNPEDNNTLWDNRAQLGVEVKPDLLISIEIARTPEQVVYEENEYTSPVHSFSGTIYETAVGPHLFLEIYVHNSGPTMASRVDITAQWPMDHIRNNSLLYLVEAPYLLRGRGRCYAGPPINPLKFNRLPMEHRLSRPAHSPPSNLPKTWNDVNPNLLHCYALNIAAGDYARIVLFTSITEIYSLF